MAITTFDPTNPDKSRDDAAGYEGRAPEDTVANVAAMDFKDPKLTEALGSLAINPDKDEDHNMFNAGPGTKNPEVQNARAHGNHSGVRIAGADQSIIARNLREEKRHTETSARIVATTLIAGAISDQLQRSISATIGDQIKGINNSHSRVQELRTQVAALEAQRADMNLLFEELTPAQQDVENRADDANTERVQTEYLEMPTQMNDMIFAAAQQVATLEGIDPDSRDYSARYDELMYQTKAILSQDADKLAEIGTLDPAAVAIAEQISNEFSGSEEDLRNTAAYSVGGGDFIEPAYGNPNILSPLAGDNQQNLALMGIAPNDYSVGSVSADLGAESTQNQIQEDYAATANASGGFENAALGNTPANTNTPTPQPTTPTYDGMDQTIRRMVEGPNMNMNDLVG